MLDLLERDMEEARKRKRRRRPIRTVRGKEKAVWTLHQTDGGTQSN